MGSQSDAKEVRAGALIMDLSHRDGLACRCGTPLCGHALLFSWALGYKATPFCSACLARALGKSPAELRAELVGYFRRRDCYLAAWHWTTAREGQCSEVVEAVEPAEGPATSGPEEAFVPDAEWNAGDMACGDLVLELRLRITALAPGEVLLVTAHDPAAPEDLPAWSRLTGHPVVYSRHPVYAFRRKQPCLESSVSA